MIESPIFSRGGLPDMCEDVIKFHKKFELPIEAKPTLPLADVKQLKTVLLFEEFTELLEAMSEDNLVEILDGLVDLIYIIIGTAIVYGLPLEEAWAEIHKTNMKKERGPSKRSEKFDIIKPEGWVKPDLITILKRARAEK